MRKTYVIAMIVMGLGILAPAWLIAGNRAGAAGSATPAGQTENAASDHQLSRDATPAGGVEALVYARPFRLEQPYRTRWSKERTDVDRGFLVVIRVEREYVFPHEAATPVLFAGDQAIERVNVGYEDGVVVGIIRGDTHPSTAPIYFGSPDYPERVTASKGLIELLRAEVRGLAARPQAEVDRAFRMDTLPLAVTDKSGLYRAAGSLIEQYAPAEAALAAELQALP